MRMKPLFLLLLIALVAGCNRDAALDNPANDPYLAPASAPLTNPEPRVPDAERNPIGAPEITTRSESGAENEPNGGALTPADRALARQMGPEKLGYDRTRTQPTPAPAPNQRQTTPTPGGVAMPAPPVLSKPAQDYDRPVLTLTKTPCYGGDGCRQYALQLTNDRRLLLTADRGMERSGKYVRTLTAREYNDILTAVEATEPADLPAVYPTDTKNIPADVQANVLTLGDVYGSPRRVEVYADAPKALTSLLTQLDAWVDREGWVKL